MKPIYENREFMKSKYGNIEYHSYISKNKNTSDIVNHNIANNSNIYIDLESNPSVKIQNESIYQCISNRRSLRCYNSKSITLSELSYILFLSQGISKSPYENFRNAPSAGAIYPFETYLYVNNVERLNQGIYKYLPNSNKLLYLPSNATIETINTCIYGGNFILDTSFVIFWSCKPYKSENIYGHFSHKMMLIEVGHICQNLYISSESVDCGACAIASYDQKKIDSILDLDGIDEFIVYLAAVGKKP